MADPSHHGSLIGRRKAGPRTLLAWAGTAVLLTYILYTTDISAAMAAVRNADLLLFFGAVAFFALVNLHVDSLTAHYVLVRSGFPVPRTEFRQIRGASYLLNVVNYGLAQAMMVGLLARRRDRGLLASGSPFLLLNFVDLTALSLIVGTALLSGLSPFGDEITAALTLAALAGLSAGPLLTGLVRLGALPRWTGRFFRNEALGAFRTPKVRDLAAMVALRTAYLLETIVEAGLYLAAFRFTVPILSLLVFEPLLVFVDVVPISVGGLGSTQVVMREFYSPFSPGGIPAVDAYSTASIVTVLMARFCIGLWYLPRMTRLKTG